MTADGDRWAEMEASYAALAVVIAERRGIEVAEAREIIMGEVARLGDLYEAGSLTMMEVQRAARALHVMTTEE